MSDKSGGFFSSVGRFFSGGSASKNGDTDKSPTSANARSSGSVVSSVLSRSPSTAPPAALLKDIISNDNDNSVDSNEVIVDTAQNPRVGSRLRYLSPSALDSRTTDPSSGLEIDVETEPDIFFSTPSVSTNRKRQLTELDRQCLPQTFRSDSVKRSRFLNRSLLEPTIRGALAADRRLDMSWCGELTSNHSPASSVTNFSLLSRRSGATTNGSLSTRTQEIYKRLEGTSTPAKEVQRMTMLRSGLSRPERWSLNDSRDLDASSTGTPPPPLKKSGDAIPSRIQLISKSMGMSARRAPYWTDLTRKRTSSKNGDNVSSETNSLKSLNGTLASTELSSVFSLEPPAPKKTASSMSAASTTSMNSSNIKKPHVSILKGPDGKPVSRNTFKLSDDIEEEGEDSQKLPPLPEATLSNPQPLKLAPGSTLKQGFLDNLAFSFSAPVDIAPAVGTTKVASIASSVRSSESKEVDSDSSAESVEKQTSESNSSESESEESESDEVADEVKESRPQTSADTVSTVSNPSSQSSKDSSPKTAKELEGAAPLVGAPVKPAVSAKWHCDVCLLSWDDSHSKCGACGGPRPGTSDPATQQPVEKQLVSNLKSFAPTQPSSFKFGFGSASNAPAASNTFFSTSTSVPFGGPAVQTSTTKTDKPMQPLFGSVASSTIAQATPATTTVTVAPKSTIEGRVDWYCPVCSVRNKSTDDKCPCCSHVKYASAEPSSNVFGNRAFKPSSGATVQFGVGASSSTTVPSFGISASKPTEPSVMAATTAPPTTSASGFSVTKPAAPTPIVSATASSPAKPIGSLFGNIAKSTESAAAAPVPVASVMPTPSSTTSLFGNNTTGLFGASKTDSTQNSALKPSIFGSLNKETPIATIATTTAPVSLAPTTKSPFGSSASVTPFGSSSAFGSQKPSVEIPKTTQALPFGAASSTAQGEAPKGSIFGNIGASSAPAPAQSAPIPATGLFGTTQPPATNLFSAKAPDSTSSSFFGKPIQFPGEVGTTTTDGGVPAKRGLFSSDATKLSFGGDQKTEPPKFGNFGGATSSTSTTSGGLFGGSTAAPLFGTTSSNIPVFASSSSTTAPAFGSGSVAPFGSSTSITAFGAFGSKPAQPGMSTSSSTNSLFGQNPADSSNPFGGSTNNNGFNFGASSSTGSTGGSGVFQFGSSASNAPALSAAPGGPFQFGNNLPAPPAPAPGSMDNAFSYQAPSSVGARKMALARRRNMRK